MHNPQSRESRRAQTKLNRRGVDLASAELSFGKGHNRKLSASHRVLHDFGTFNTLDDSDDSDAHIEID